MDTNDQIREDVSQARDILGDLPLKLKDISKNIKELSKRYADGLIQTSSGISLFNLKNNLLLSYLTNLTHLMLCKFTGQSIKDSPDVERLVEIRTVLEKMRPLERKLKYQVDKLIKLASGGHLADDDPLNLRPDPDNLTSRLDESEEEDVDSETGEQTDDKKIYRPPKLTPVPYDRDETVQQKQEKLLERRKKKILSSSIMKDLQREYSQGPEEIRDTADFHRVKEDRAAKERQEYEEKYFIRMSVTKKERAASRRLQTMTDLDSLTHFGDLSGIGTNEAVGVKKGKKRKSFGSGKKKGGKKKRIRR